MRSREVSAGLFTSEGLDAILKSMRTDHVGEEGLPFQPSEAPGDDPPPEKAVPFHFEYHDGDTGEQDRLEAPPFEFRGSLGKQSPGSLAKFMGPAGSEEPEAALNQPEEGDEGGYQTEEMNPNDHDFGLGHEEIPRSSNVPAAAIRKADTAAEIAGIARSLVINRYSRVSQSEFDLMWDPTDSGGDFCTVMRQPKKIGTHIPPQVAALWSLAVFRTMELVTDFPGDKSLALLLCLPVLILWKKNGKTTEIARMRHVASRSALIIAGKFLEAFELVREEWRSHTAKTEERYVKITKDPTLATPQSKDKQILKFVDSNKPSRALAAALGKLGQAYIFDSGDNAEIEALIAKKIPPMDRPEFLWSRDELLEYLEQLGVPRLKLETKEMIKRYTGKKGSQRKCSGAGQSGWNFDILRVAFAADPNSMAAVSLYDKYTAMCELIVGGKVSEAMLEILQGFRLLILKSDGKSRIVAPQELFFRDASAMAANKAKKLPGFNDFFKNQLALGVKNGAAVLAFLSNSKADSLDLENESWVSLESDMANQHHAFDRPHALEGILEDYTELDLRPLLYYWSSLMYDVPGYIPQTGAEFNLRSGSPQGNSATSILANFVAKRALDDVPKGMPPGSVKLHRLYGDNLRVIVRAENLMEFMQRRDEALVDTGYVWSGKSDKMIFSCDPGPVIMDQCRAQFPLGEISIAGGLPLGSLVGTETEDQYGTIILGIPTPFTHDLASARKFQADHVTKICERATDALRVIKDLKLPKVVQSQLVQECIIPRIAFIAGAVPPQVTSSIFRDHFDPKILSFYEGLIERSLTANQKRQLQLPRLLGGFGVRPMESAASPAYLATLVQILQTFDLGLSNFDVSKQIDIYNMLVLDRDKIPKTDDGLTELKRRTQKELTLSVWMKQTEELMAKLDPDDKWTLKVAQQSGSGAWISQSWIGSNFESFLSSPDNLQSTQVLISDPVWSVLSRRRIILDGTESNFYPRGSAFPEIPCRMMSAAGNLCQKMGDRRLFHSEFGCLRTRGKTHFEIQEALKSVLHVFETRTFAVPACPAAVGKKGNDKRGDIFVHGLVPGHFSSVLDVSIRSPYTQGARAGRRIGGTFSKHITTAENQKTTKYAGYSTIGIGFTPFVMSSSGVFGEQAKMVVQNVAKLWSYQSSGSHEYVASRIYLYLRCIMWRQLAMNCFNMYGKLHNHAAHAKLL